MILQILASPWLLAFVVFGVCLPLTFYGLHRYHIKGLFLGVSPIVVHTLVLRLLV